MHVLPIFIAVWTAVAALLLSLAWWIIANVEVRQQIRLHGVRDADAYMQMHLMLTLNCMILTLTMMIMVLCIAT
jgi:hypothetical protein